MNLADMITDAKEIRRNPKIEERMKKAIEWMMESINNAKEQGKAETYWMVPEDLDFQLKELFKSKGYKFKNVPYRPGHYGHGEYIVW